MLLGDNLIWINLEFSKLTILVCEGNSSLRGTHSSYILAYAIVWLRLLAPLHPTRTMEGRPPSAAMLCNLRTNFHKWTTKILNLLLWTDPRSTICRVICVSSRKRWVIKPPFFFSWNFKLFVSQIKGVTAIVRVTEETYDAAEVEKAGISMHEVFLLIFTYLLCAPKILDDFLVFT